MDQMRIPGSKALNKMLCSSGFRATPPILAAMQLGEDLVKEGRKSRSERMDTKLGDMRSLSVVNLWQLSIKKASSPEASPSGTSLNLVPVEKLTADDEDDYSASVCSTVQQRHATQWQNLRKRRLSAPYDDITRRRASIYTMSLGDTAISMSESGGQEQISENLTQHKEVLSGIKQQPWPLRRKIKLVRQTKAYIRRHEDALQEKLVQSRSTRNIVARILLFQTKKWQFLRNGLINLQTWLVPWEVRIMEIKSHFGSAVASYFIFLRWLFYINLVIAVTYSAFVAIPKVLIANATLAGENKMPNEEIAKSTDLLTLWEFEGALKHSPFFYGWYTSHDSNGYYKLPLAYFVTNLVLYMYSFVSIILKMVKNSRLSILIEKEDEYVFSRKLFTVWNFMIDNPKTADDRTASIALGFKEAILEEVETQKNEKIWRIITIRIFINVVVLSLFALSVYTVVGMAKWSGYEVENGIEQRTSSNKFTFVMSLIANIFPKLFDILGSLEKYHPRKQLRVQLARIMFLNLLNIYSLITALFDNIFLMKLQMCLYQVVQCGNNLTIKQVVTLMDLYPILNNVTHSYARKEIPEPTLPFVRQETCSLNPLDNDTLCKDFNDTNYNNYNVSYGNYHYETSDMGNGDEFSTTPYEEQDTGSEDGSQIHYDESSTIIANFLVDPMTVEQSYASSTLSQNESTTITSESYTMGDSRISFVKTFHVTSAISDATLTYILKNNITTSPFNKHTKFSSKINYMKGCLEKICVSSKRDLERLRPKCKKFLCSRLDHLCWETMVGQELTKLVVMDLILNVVGTLGRIFFRPAFVRVVNKCWCWKLEKHGDFKIAENILHLVYNQGIVWMGMFFSPGLTALNVFKLSILMYLRSWEVLTSKVPNKVVFRASRSNNFYFGLLFIMLFVSVSSIGYIIIRVQPSWHCGPFSDYPKIYNLATSNLTELPRQIQDLLDYVASPGTVIPLIIFMTLIIYYMASLVGSLREANKDQKMQLRYERTEERRKLFRIAGKRYTMAEIPLSRSGKILPTLSPDSISRNFKTAHRDNVQIGINMKNKRLMIEKDIFSNRKDRLRGGYCPIATSNKPKNRTI